MRGLPRQPVQSSAGVRWASGQSTAVTASLAAVSWRVVEEFEPAGNVAGHSDGKPG